MPYGFCERRYAGRLCRLEVGDAENTMTHPGESPGETSFGAGGSWPCALMKLRDTDMRAAPLVLWAAYKTKIMLKSDGKYYLPSSSTTENSLKPDH